MQILAKTLLYKLQKAGEKAEAGVSSRTAALTSRHLASYHSTRSLTSKEEFETFMLAARAEGCISIEWDSGGSESRIPEEMIRRVALADLTKLANFLGQPLLTDLIATATHTLSDCIDEFPILCDVLESWGKLRLIRGHGPERAHLFSDAAKLIRWTKVNFSDGESASIREASANLFRDSKRIEKITPVIDILLSGDVSVGSRHPDEILQEVGLYREEQPMLLAGAVVIERSRVVAVLDEPYAGLPTLSIVRCVGVPRCVMTIENLTTFHSEARRRCSEEILLIYTGGMPSPRWRAAYKRLIESIPAETDIFHWGDLDEGGFRIAALIARDLSGFERRLRPWKMHPNDVPVTARRPAPPGVTERMSRYAERAGWLDIAHEVTLAKFTVEQEALSGASE